MKHLYTIPAICLSILLVACQQKVEIQPATHVAASVSPRVSDQIATGPPVLFQFAELDHNQGVLSGFLIDSEGMVHQYELTDIPSEYQYFELRRIPDFILEEVLASAEPSDVRVDLNELNRNYRLISRVRDHDLDVQATNPDASVSRAFYAFTTLIEDGESSYPASSCGDRGTHERSEDSVDYLFVPLQAEGKKTLTHTSQSSEEIVGWLIGVLE